MVDKKPNQNQRENRRIGDQARLESWKAIANFLSRSVRTVRRWEESEGLPVHRLRHKRGNSVYAYETELDAWRMSHREILPGQQAVESTDRSGSFAGLYGIALLSALVLGIFVGHKYTAEDTVTAGVGNSIEAYSAIEAWPEDVAAVIVEPIYAAWQRGDARTAYEESQRVTQHLHDLPDSVRQILIRNLVEISISLGRIDDAIALSKESESVDLQNELMVSIAFATGDKAKMVDLLNSTSTFSYASTALYMSMVGMNDRAIELTSLDNGASSRKNVILALAAMQAGNEESAKILFQQAENQLSIADKGFYFVAFDKLSGLRKADGALDDSIRILESTMDHRDDAIVNGSAIFWMMCQKNLASLYSQVGRHNEEEAIYESLHKRLALADERFPLAKSLAGV